MLTLNKIIKDYPSGDVTVHALKGINISFRDNEFVSILGQSGCGKTTMLNIIGGLDQYTSGDLIIKGKSTKTYKTRDWDAYRNNSVGFVFQSYNLITHQSVLSNVELALTLSGVSKSERKKRAIEVLNKVGLGDQINKKPTQMSGGQMQRVAIARALINDPEILLADEPTGALDTETSVQIMELLKEIAKDRLVIMVTHNPELSKQYSTRIINLLDGEVINDSNPFIEETKEKADGNKLKHNKMSFFTALNLSFNNLLTKKTRTLMTAFAGSIGIIGIALIMSLSSGFQNYISNVEKDTLSTYPIDIAAESVDSSTMMQFMIGGSEKKEVTHEKDKIYSNNMLSDQMNTMIGEVKRNDMSSFSKYIEEHQEEVSKFTTDVVYKYNMNLIAYKSDTSNGAFQVNPSVVMDNMGMGTMADMMNAYTNTSSMMKGYNVWSEMLNNTEFLQSQYDLVAGEWPDSFDEVVLVVDKNNEITDYELYSLGIRDIDEVSEIMQNTFEGKIKEFDQTTYTYDELIGLSYKVVPAYKYYKYDDKLGYWVNKGQDESYVKNLVDNGIEVKISAIIRPSEKAEVHSITTSIAYSHDLVEYIINETNNSDIVLEQQKDKETNVLTGLKFGEKYENNNNQAPDVDSIISYLVSSGMSQGMSEEELTAYIENMSANELAEMMEQVGMNDDSNSITNSETNPGEEFVSKTYDDLLVLLGVCDLNDPYVISLYPKDFEAKEEVIQFIEDYNSFVKEQGSEDKVISYSDLVGTMMSSISTIINTISYVLVAFVAISLVVSSIMIGIITYISVLERTKEIGILRSIGASKKDISRVFNAETLIIGFVSGVIGIVVTMILNIPASLIIESVADVPGVSKLPLSGALGLITISMILTLIAGLIPSKVAAKKDPVVALRGE